MKLTYWLLIFGLCLATLSCSQKANIMDKETSEAAIGSLIETYVQAREAKDTSLLKSILTADIDQLTSSGNWRNGIQESIEGMQRSSASNPGKRTITVEKIKFLSDQSAIADTRYEIENADGSTRRMWSTFIVKQEEQQWKISGIRNMLPAGN